MPLEDRDIVTTRVSSRRNFLSRATGVALGALGAATAATAAAAAEKKKKKDVADYIQADNKAKTPHDQNKRSGDLVGK